MKLRLTALILTLLLLSSACSGLYATYSDRLCKVEWQGEVNAAMVQQVKVDLARFEFYRCSTARIYVFSPGGFVVDGLEILRLMEHARQRMILETHGGSIAASMATFVLAAGSPGHRYTWRHTLTLIHGPKTQTGFDEFACLAIIANPTTENEKLGNQIVRTMAAVYAELTGNPLSVTTGWLECGKEQAGDGYLLVKLGIADYIES